MEFFYRDLSGRGYTNTFDEKVLSYIIEEETNDDDQTIQEWLENGVEIGDKYTTRTFEIIRIK